MIVSNDSVSAITLPYVWQLTDNYGYTHYYSQTNTLSQMAAIHSWLDFDDLPRGQPKWERDQRCTRPRTRPRPKNLALRPCWPRGLNIPGGKYPVCLLPVALWFSGLVSINEATLHRARWVLGWVTGKLSRYVNSHPYQLSLAMPPWVGGLSTSEGCRRVSRHAARCTSPVFVFWQCKLVSGWGLRKRRSAPPYGPRGSGRNLHTCLLPS